MPSYAMVVVVEANDDDDAHERLDLAVGREALFVGEPWEVRRAAANFDGDFDTDDCLNQRRTTY